MEAYFATLTKASGASGFLIVRDDAVSPVLKKTVNKQFSSSSESYCSSISSTSSNPCLGPPSLPRRKRSSDDLSSKVTTTRSGEKGAKTRVLKSFFDEVMGPAAESSKRDRSHDAMDYMHDAIHITSPSSSNSRKTTKQSKRWDANA
ncbi:unnamed protein product [Cylindrotheca closterium]|uniref:Uncharacterized protein n=1 Tax=Cylindrotheca closterium TaxID=2856 RepID=A0AAD2FPZ5_9STRA|nr:unnamed protein product [Cylindrotheca closterium]